MVAAFNEVYSVKQNKNVPMRIASLWWQLIALVPLII